MEFGTLVMEMTFDVNYHQIMIISAFVPYLSVMLCSSKQHVVRMLVKLTWGQQVRCILINEVLVMDHRYWN